MTNHFGDERSVYERMIAYKRKKLRALKLWFGWWTTELGWVRRA